MKCNYSWGTVDELIMLGILARINVSYINAADKEPSIWVITDVNNENTLGIPNDPIYAGKSLIVLFAQSSIYLYLWGTGSVKCLVFTLSTFT